MTVTDPVEKIIADALDAAGLEYQHDCPLDFLIPELGVYIECKRFVTDRLVRQIGLRENVIVVIGLDGARALAKLIVARVPA